MFGFIPVVLVGLIVDVSVVDVGVVEVIVVLVAGVESKKKQKIQEKYTQFVLEIILLNSVIYHICHVHLYELL